MKPGLPELIAGAKRELQRRHRAFPKAVAADIMTVDQADYETDIMLGIVTTLTEINNGKWKRED
jgi:hypothetical protein